MEDISPLSDYEGSSFQKLSISTYVTSTNYVRTSSLNLNGSKMSFKEKREFEQLEKDIATLEDEKKQIEDALSSGTLSVDEITQMSKRLPLLNDELDEKSMRWLELSELA